jgi:hypothetical protein
MGSSVPPIHENYLLRMCHHILIGPTLNLYLFRRSCSNFSWNTNWCKFLSWFYIVSKEIPGWYDLLSNKRWTPPSKSLSDHYSLLFYPPIRRRVTSDVETEPLGNLRINTFNYTKNDRGTINLPSSRTSDNECPHYYVSQRIWGNVCLRTGINLVTSNISSGMSLRPSNSGQWERRKT